MNLLKNLGIWLLLIIGLSLLIGLLLDKGRLVESAETGT